MNKIEKRPAHQSLDAVDRPGVKALYDGLNSEAYASPKMAYFSGRPGSLCLSSICTIEAGEYVDRTIYYVVDGLPQPSIARVI